jgi:serine phosphatase RsbU (regulator of sigma subunit)
MVVPKTPRGLIKLNGILVQENIEKHITMIARILNLETHQLHVGQCGHYHNYLWAESSSKMATW